MILGARWLLSTTVYTVGVVGGIEEIRWGREHSRRSSSGGETGFKSDFKMRTAQRLSLLFRLILRKVDSERSLCIGGQLRADFSVRGGGVFIQKKEE